jgi:2-polyprenyl-6-hydroxyphenyl methylase/3-demethylubiquinone-9 3-methyltransferase
LTGVPTRASCNDRFHFGANWLAFLGSVDENRIRTAESSLLAMLGITSLAQRRFLDIGCGSGLFSLAARRAGATVHSFDFDPQSVACAQELKRRFLPADNQWHIEQGSVLDDDYMHSLGHWDVAYSWGVLHHTGELWRSLELAADAVAPGGQLYIAIYNDQGGASRRWLRVKQLYQRLPVPLQPVLVFGVATVMELKYAVVRLLQGRNPLPMADWRAKKRDRGMSVWHDWVDWVGGWPFQVAKPEAVILPLRARGFVLDNLVTCGSGHGCNQYVFRRALPSALPG